MAKIRKRRSLSKNSYQPGQTGAGYIDVTMITDLHGECAYTHEPALEVVLNVHASLDPGMEKR
jgi:hypothetical protein